MSTMAVRTNWSFSELTYKNLRNKITPKASVDDYLSRCVRRSLNDWLYQSFFLVTVYFLLNEWSCGTVKWPNQNQDFDFSILDFSKNFKIFES